MKGDDLKAKIY